MSEYKIIIIDDSRLFDERESGIIHTSYKSESEFFSYIKKGSRTNVTAAIKQFKNNGIVIGKMSENPLKQIQYWAVASSAIAVRYAIQGGLDETTAYNFADNCIMEIDKMNNCDEILSFLMNKCVELTDMVAQSRENSVYPRCVRECLHYINTHLHEKLDVKTLASHCGLSADYLSALFKKNIGINLSSYIRNQRLQASKEMLAENYSVSDIAYYLGFCSESYFIYCFKKAFGKTPKQYKNQI